MSNTTNISPLAQTFKIDDTLTLGCYLTSIDLYFAAAGVSDTNSVYVQLVTTLNGYPTSTILGGAHGVISPNAITASSTSLVATNCKFPVPIYVEQGVEYAIKVISNSLTYKVWCSIKGLPQITSPSIQTTAAPFVGQLFKSQNNSTWVPELLENLSFVLYRAKFNNSIPSKIRLVESPTSNYFTLDANPFRLTNGTTLVKVHHQNHGLVSGMQVTYSGSTDTQFNGTFNIVTVLNTNYYTINVGVAATATNFSGGFGVTVEKNIVYHSVSLPDTAGLQTGATISLTGQFTGAATPDVSLTPLSFNTVNYLGVNKYIYSSINKATILAGASSFNMNASLSSTSDAISPIIDLNSLNLQLLSNKINSPLASADVNYVTDGQVIVVGASNVSFNATGNVITIPATTDYTQIVLGSWVKISDTGGSNDTFTGYISSINQATNSIVLTGSTLVTQASRSATITQYSTYVDESANGGTAESKYISKPITVPNHCTGFRVIVDFNVPVGCSVLMYYRTILNNSGTALVNTAWTNYPITYKGAVNETDYTEYQYDLTNLPSYDQFQFKFVLNSTLTYETPKIKNLRVISHA